MSDGGGAHLSLELLHYVFEEVLIEVLSSQKGVPIGGLHLKHSLLDLQDRDIKGASPQVVHGDAGTLSYRRCKNRSSPSTHTATCGHGRAKAPHDV